MLVMPFSDDSQKEESRKVQREKDLEYLRSRAHGKRPSDEEMAAIVRSHSEGPFELELMYDEEKNLITLSGNREGLASVKKILDTLTREGTRPGRYVLLDEHTNLTKTNTKIIIKLSDKAD